MAVAVGAPAQQQPPPPLSLVAATNAALQQVSAFQQAQIDEAIAAADLRQARAALLPRARDSFSITYNSPEAHSNPPVPSFIAANAIHEYQNLLGVTGEWNFGLVAAVRRSRALLDAARAGTEIARRALIRGVAEAYYGAALATAKRDAAEQSLAAAEEFQRVTCLNFDAGEVPEVDCIRARLQAAARRDDLLQARQQEAIANASLGTLLGYGITLTRPSATLSRDAGEGRGEGLPAIEALPQTIDAAAVDQLTAAGVQRRPEFAQVNAQLVAARAGVSVARADFLPKITYSLDKGFDTDSLRHDERSKHQGTLATATVDVPLFDWGATYSKWRQAQLQVRASELQRQLTTRELYLQFLTARQEAVTAAERIDNARRALADAERNVTISIARYRAGEAPVTEATEAQTTRAQQRLSLQQALFDYQVALAHLREAAGE
jgi:outer membrane protein TolC